MKVSEVFNPTPRQDECLRMLARKRFVLYGGAMGGGKLLPLGMQIPTPTGWVKLGEMSVGDELFDEKGSVCHVVAVSDISTAGNRYQITFDDGTTVEADECHEWYTWSFAERSQRLRRSLGFRNRRKASRASRAVAISKKPGVSASIALLNRNRVFEFNPPSGSVRTTKEIFETPVTLRGGYINHAVEVAGPLQLPPAELPIDPYVFGAWLGDGTCGNGGLTGVDPEIWRKIERAGYKVAHAKPGARETHHHIYGLIQKLRAIGCDRKQFIPPCYLRGSIAQRLEFLRGLLDTDGHCAKDGQVEFCNTRKLLCDTVYELAVSLGIKAFRREKRAILKGVDHGPVYMVFWTHTLPVFSLKRKLDRLKTGLRETQRYRYIMKVEPSESVPMRCIQVSAASHQYLCSESMIPTHNSYLLRWWCVQQCMYYAARYKVRNVRIGLFSEDYPTLVDRQISRIKFEFPAWLGRIAESRTEGFNFKLCDALGGGTIAFRNLDDPSKYNSAEFASIAVEELTKDKEDVFHELRKRMRWPGIPDSDTRFLGATNPGGPGHAWVKRFWLDHDLPREMASIAHEFHYVQSRAQDNPHLSAGYYESLLTLPHEMAKAYAEGDWDLFAGQYFKEWRKDVHVCAPFEVPWFWRIRRCGDWGHAAPCAYGWIATSPEGKKWLIGEVYGSGLSIKEQAAAIHAFEQGKAVEPVGSLDEACWKVEGDGKSIAAQFYDYGVKWFPCAKGPGSRVAGWHVLRQQLAFERGPDGVLTKEPNLHIFSTCPHTIRTLPSLEHDPLHPEDCSSDGEDHAADMIRYGLMGIPPQMPDTEMSEADAAMLAHADKRYQEARL